MDKMVAPMKAFFLLIGIVLWSGIWLTGFDAAHWLLYIPATFFLAAAITGICPGLLFFNGVFREEKSQRIE